jgi:hypothetical protein
MSKRTDHINHLADLLREDFKRWVTTLPLESVRIVHERLERMTDEDTLDDVYTELHLKITGTIPQFIQTVDAAIAQSEAAQSRTVKERLN